MPADDPGPDPGPNLEARQLGRRPRPTKLKAINEPPARPRIRNISLSGFAVLRFHGELQPAGLPALDGPASERTACYAELHDSEPAACAAARVGADQAFARGATANSCEHGVRHVVAVEIVDWYARDFRPIAMPDDALLRAVEDFCEGVSAGQGCEPWWRLAGESRGGLVLPLLDRAPGAFVLMYDDVRSCIKRLEVRATFRPGMS
jgi:hypothetical protein